MDSITVVIIRQDLKYRYKVVGENVKHFIIDTLVMRDEFHYQSHGSVDLFLDEKKRKKKERKTL